MGNYLLSLSGGLDSSTLLGYLINAGHNCVAVSFNYGSKHNKYENEAARVIAGYYKIRLIEIDLSNAMIDIKSALMKSGGAIPEGHYEADTMKQTVVPCRNMIFLSIMAGIAESEGIENLAIGVHAGDHVIYPDCRPDFIVAMIMSVRLSTDGKVNTISTPFIMMGKHSIIELGTNQFDIPVPYRFTRTCYKDQPVACGLCGSCIERKEAFKINGLVDPIDYEV